MHYLDTMSVPSSRGPLLSMRQAPPGVYDSSKLYVGENLYGSQSFGAAPRLLNFTSGLHDPAPQLSSSPSILLAAAKQVNVPMLQQARASFLLNNLRAAQGIEKELVLGNAIQTVHPPNETNSGIPPTAIKALGRTLRSPDDPYIDVSTVAIGEEDKDEARRTRGGVAEPFPEKLHRLLQDSIDDDLGDVVSFLSHGRAFRVHNMDRFLAEVLPKYFKQTKWSSFSRQLSLYGFQRIQSGTDTGGYYHELFLRGMPHLSWHMRRVGVPTGSTDRRKSAHRSVKMRSEPDFYKMKALPCTDAIKAAE